MLLISYPAYAYAYAYAYNIDARSLIKVLPYNIII